MDNRQKLLYGTSVIMLIFSALSSQTLAHGTGGYIQKIQGNNRIDIDYPNPTLLAGKPTFFNIRLFDANSPDPLNATPIPFNNVEIYILQDNNQIFSSNIFKAPQKASGFTMVFPSAGTYTLYTLFYKAGASDTFLKESFDITVLPQTAKNGSWFSQLITEETLLGAIIGLVLGLLIANIYLRFVP